MLIILLLLLLLLLFSSSSSSSCLFFFIFFFLHLHLLLVLMNDSKLPQRNAQNIPKIKERETKHQTDSKNKPTTSRGDVTY